MLLLFIDLKVSVRWQVDLLFLEDVSPSIQKSPSVNIPSHASLEMCTIIYLLSNL